jgi:hypothetical protein
MAAGSAKSIADLIDGKSAAIDLNRYGVERF